MRATLASKAKINKIIEKRLKEVSKKYGTDRRTTIVSAADVMTDVNTEEEIPDYQVKLFPARQRDISKRFR